MPLLSVSNLSVTVSPDICLVDTVSFSVTKGEITALIGQSGSGKTTIAQAIGQIYLPGQRPTLSGSIRFRGHELIGLSEKELRGFRGRHIAYVFQDPLAALNPIQPVGCQIAESLMLTHRITFDEAFEQTVSMMEKVFLPRPRELFWRYPYELSGGMRQRVVIAAVASCRPELIIADEPTSALDAALQVEILEILLKEVRADHAGLLIITHDFSLVEKIATFVYVLDKGKIVEEGAMQEILAAQKAPQTASLVAAFKRLREKESWKR